MTTILKAITKRHNSISVLVNSEAVKRLRATLRKEEECSSYLRRINVDVSDLSEVLSAIADLDK